MEIGSTQPADYQQAPDSLLSAKMDKLVKRNQRNIVCLEVRTESPSHSSSFQPIKTNSLRSQKLSNHNLNRSIKSPLKHKHSRYRKKTQTVETMSDFLRRKGVKLFQITKASQIRKPSMTQVKDVPVTQFTGEGILVLPNNKKYIGEWVDGMLVGIVKITYPNGDIYTGEVYQYQKHGKGQLFLANGGKYIGQFSGSDFHGEGILYDQFGQIVYDGLWRRGKRYDL